MKRLLSLILVIMLMTMAVLTGCSDNGNNNVADAPESTVEVVEAPVDQEAMLTDAVNEQVLSVIPDDIDAEQFLNYPLYMDPTVIDGTMTNSGTDATFICNVNIPLIEIGQNENGLMIVGGGAKSWEISDDGLVYTFHLREFYWEDDMQVTADQYEYSLKRALDPEVGSQVSYMLFDIKNAEKAVKSEVSIEEIGVKAIDDLTLEITLEKVTPYFIQLAYSPMFTPTREDLIEEFGSAYGTDADKIMSCGPFKMTEWVHDSYITLEKNEKYWNADVVALETINFKLIKDRQAMMSELMNHSIDRTSVSTMEWREKLIAMDEFTYGDYILSGTYSLFLNTGYESPEGVKILSNTKVRQAIAASIDKAEATLMLKGNMAIPATGYVPSELQMDGLNYRDASGYSVTNAFDGIDPKALLIEGLEELGVEPDPTLYSIEYLVGSTTATAKKDAEYFYETIRNDLGLNLEIIQVESGVARERGRNGDYGISYQTSYADYNDPSTYLNGWITYLETHVHETFYDNTEYDNLIDAANNSTDTYERLRLFSEGEKLLVETDCIIIPIYHPMSSMMNAAYMKGFINQNYTATQFKTVYTQGRGQ